jgi:hypothetical protein
VRVLLLSAMLLSVAACSSPGVPGSNVNIIPPGFAERPSPTTSAEMAAAPAPVQTVPLQPATQPGTPVPLTPAAPPPVVTAAVAPPPPPPAPVAVAPPPPPPPVMAATAPPPPPPPPVVAATAPPPPPPAPGFPFALPAWPFFVSNQPVPGQLPGPRLTLSNFSYDRARVEATVTASPDCGAGAVSRVEFDLAYNGTRVIEPPIGDDVCWRRDMATDRATGPQWSRWNRAFLSAGQSVDSRL